MSYYFLIQLLNTTSHMSRITQKWILKKVAYFLFQHGSVFYKINSFKLFFFFLIYFFLIYRGWPFQAPIWAFVISWISCLYYPFFWFLKILCLIYIYVDIEIKFIVVYIHLLHTFSNYFTQHFIQFLDVSIVC